MSEPGDFRITVTRNDSLVDRWQVNIDRYRGYGWHYEDSFLSPLKWLAIAAARRVVRRRRRIERTPPYVEDWSWRDHRSD